MGTKDFRILRSSRRVGKMPFWHVCINHAILHFSFSSLLSVFFWHADDDRKIEKQIASRDRDRRHCIRSNRQFEMHDAVGTIEQRLVTDKCPQKERAKNEKEM